MNLWNIQSAPARTGQPLILKHVHILVSILMPCVPPFLKNKYMKPKIWTSPQQSVLRNNLVGGIRPWTLILLWGLFRSLSDINDFQSMNAIRELNASYWRKKEKMFCQFWYRQSITGMHIIMREKQSPGQSWSDKYIRQLFPHWSTLAVFISGSFPKYPNTGWFAVFCIHFSSVNHHCSTNWSSNRPKVFFSGTGETTTPRLFMKSGLSSRTNKSLSNKLKMLQIIKNNY